MDERKKKKEDKSTSSAKKHGKGRSKQPTPGSQTWNSSKQMGTRRQNDQEEEEKLLNLLETALKKFPPSCSTCDPHKCDKTYDVENSRQLELDLQVFEKEHLPSLKKAPRPQFGRETLLHIMVKGWSKGAWSPKQKRFLSWMLQQRDFRDLLEQQNEEGSTPMHIALFKKLDEFVNCVLEEKNLRGIIKILKTDSASAGNCLHIATKCNFPNLKVMIDRCAGDKDVLVSKNRSHKDTPLHIAVKELSLPVEDLPDPPQASEETDEEFVVHSEQDDENYGNNNINNSDFSQYREEDDPDYRPDADNEDGSDNDSENNDSETIRQKRYKPETDEERRNRLWDTLYNLKEEIARPRPPLPPHSVKEGRPGQTDTTVPIEATSLHLIDLHLTHNVRLLVEANPEALETPNEEKRTPYREREEALLKDRIVQGVISEYASAEYARRQNFNDSEEDESDSDSVLVLESDRRMEDLKKWAERMIVIKDPVAYYIRSFCLRKSKSREETMSRLYQPGKECHIEFDLAGMPNTVIPQAYLDQLALHLKFESILKYVALPAVSIERQTLPSQSNRFVTY